MYALPPDLDEALIAFLRDHPALAPLHNGRVSTYLQSNDEPSVRTAALGGVQPWPWHVVAEYQIEAWGGDQHEASVLIRTCLAAVYDIRGPVSDGYVSGVAVVLSPVWSPDEQTGRPRYLAQVSLTAHPEESTT